MSYLARSALSAAAILIYGWINQILHPVEALMVGKVAGQQLQSSDTGYLTAVYGVNFFHHLGVPFIILLLVLVMIWWRPLRYFVGMSALLATFVGHPAYAYYQKSDYAEPVMVEPNESAFWVPSIGDNEASQTKTNTEDYYRKSKVFKKLFLVPHMHLAGSGAFFDYYVPAGTLIIVDQSMYSHEWVASTQRGTANKDQGIHCQSSEGLDVTVGVSIGTEVTEEQAPRYLSHFKVKANEGSRTDPQVMFSAVYYSPSLAEVMDNVLRPVIGQMVCKQIMIRTVDQGAAQATAMMEIIKQEVEKYLDGVGIKLDNIGWADTFTYGDAVQHAMDQRYAVEKLRPVIDLLQQKALIDAVQKSWNGALPQNINVTFWPDSWTQAIKGILHLNATTPPVKTEAPAH